MAIIAKNEGNGVLCTFLHIFFFSLSKCCEALRGGMEKNNTRQKEGGTTAVM